MSKHASSFIFEVVVLSAAALLPLLNAGAAAAQPVPSRPAELHPKPADRLGDPEPVPLRADPGLLDPRWREVPVPALAPPPASSPPELRPYPPPGYARWILPAAPADNYLDDLPEATEGRHAGFFMRLGIGPGYYTMHARSSEGTLALRAAGAGLHLALGGAFQESFVIYGEIALQSTLDPQVNVDRGKDAQLGTSVTTTALGAGIGRYFMPSNVYLAGSLLIAQTRAVDRPTEQLLGQTELGPAVALSIGKEWWLSSSWALGLVTRAQLARLRDRSHGQAGAVWDAAGLSTAFTVTFE